MKEKERLRVFSRQNPFRWACQSILDQCWQT